MIGSQEVLIQVTIFCLAVGWDALFGDPRRFHPVAGIGKIISVFESRAPNGKLATFLYGFALALLLPASLALAVQAIGDGLRLLNVFVYIVAGAFILKVSFASRDLRVSAMEICSSLKQGRLNDARESLKSLVSRDTSNLPPELAASAAIESVAENATDGFLAPWLAFALFGLPGAVAYRAINTLDSMIAYHGRYEYLGKATARLDDALNLIPARLAGLLIVLSASLRGPASLARAFQLMRRDHGKTKSPNAGWTMGAMAGALGVQLEKVGHYRLGAGGPPKPEDIAISVGIARSVAVLSFLLTLLILLVRYGPVYG